MKTPKAPLLFLLLTLLTLGATPGSKLMAAEIAGPVKVKLDLVNVTKDQVQVTVTAPAFNTDVVVYHFAKIIPGTYAIADYGKFIKKLEARDANGKKLSVKKKDVNTYEIKGAQTLSTITYLVNDTYDTEKGQAFDDHGKTIFSPAGTNILAGKNFMLNMSGFVGYFDGSEEASYEVTIEHPANLWAGTALTDADNSNQRDYFSTHRFAELVDNPIMYSEPDSTTFKIGDLEVTLSVYSPNNKKITAATFGADLQRMVKAQKAFLGDINKTQRYAVLLYVVDGSASDAGGIGALEHNNCTTVTFRENMSSQDLIDIISHEFFHTLTPLNVHSKEIQYFDFANPQMSEHLWLYEGITEYFAHLFQVNQGLITEDEFYKVIAEKIEVAKQRFNDKLSFTEMSKNVLRPPYKGQYANVYLKGALMAMCIDIIMRDNSNGTRGIKDMMGDLAKIYGPQKPFDDNELFDKIKEIAYPEVTDFIQKYVVNGGVIDYPAYLRRAGIDTGTVKVAGEIVFVANRKPYIVIAEDKEVVALNPEGNDFFTSLGVKQGDVLVEMNGTRFNGRDKMSVIMLGYNLKEGSPVKLKVNRNGETMELSGTVKLNYGDGPGFIFTNPEKETLKNAWLKG